MSSGTEFGAWQLHIPIATQEVNRGHLVAFAAIKTGHAAAHRVSSRHQALGSILAVGLVAGARLQQDHRWRVLAEQTAVGGED